MQASERDVVIRRFLTYLFEDIDFNYTNLTQQEKTFCSREEFFELVSWVKEDLKAVNFARSQPK